MDDDPDRNANGENRVAHAREKARGVDCVVASDASRSIFASLDCHFRTTGADPASATLNVYDGAGPTGV